MGETKIEKGNMENRMDSSHGGDVGREELTLPREVKLGTMEEIGKRSLSLAIVQFLTKKQKRKLVKKARKVPISNPPHD